MASKQQITAPRIIIDTREQRPYSFENSITTKLDTGDYSLEGYTDKICVERKSIDDYVQTLIRHRDRFKKELKRMENLDHACIVVECSLLNILRGEYTSKAFPASIIGMTMSIIIAFKVPVFFCGDRKASKLFTEKYLMRAFKELNKKEGKQDGKSNSKNNNKK